MKKIKEHVKKYSSLYGSEKHLEKLDKKTLINLIVDLDNQLESWMNATDQEKHYLETVADTLRYVEGLK